MKKADSDSGSMEKKERGNAKRKQTDKHPLLLRASHPGLETPDGSSLHDVL